MKLAAKLELGNFQFSAKLQEEKAIIINVMAIQNFWYLKKGVINKKKSNIFVTFRPISTKLAGKLYRSNSYFLAKF